MDEGVTLDDAQLDALRRRVYQRGAPPEAVREYSAALALHRTTAMSHAPLEGDTARPERAESDDTRAPAAPHRWAAGAGIVALAAVVVAAVLTSQPAGRAPRPSTRPAAAGLSVPAAVLPEAPPVPGLVLASLSSAGPRTSERLDGHGHTVLLASLCDGDGTVSIHVSDGSTTVLACGDGMPALVMVPTAKPIGRFTVTTESQGHPQWTLTVGMLFDEVS